MHYVQKCEQGQRSSTSPMQCLRCNFFPSLKGTHLVLPLYLGFWNPLGKFLLFREGSTILLQNDVRINFSVSSRYRYSQLDQKLTFHPADTFRICIYITWFRQTWYRPWKNHRSWVQIIIGGRLLTYQYRGGTWCTSSSSISIYTVHM